MAIIDTDELTHETEWVDELSKQREILGREPELKLSLTKRCLQHMWSAAYYFPCCPKDVGTKPLEAYSQNLKVGAVFAYNNDSPKLTMLESVLIKNNSSILVMCEREDRICERDGYKPWLIAEIKFENDFFVHSNLYSYFEKDYAVEAFCILKVSGMSV